MKRILSLLLFLAPAIMFAQVLKVTLPSGDSLGVNFSDIKYILPSGAGSVLIKGDQFEQIRVTETVATLVTSAGGGIVKFTDEKDGNVKAVACQFIDKLFPSSSGSKTTILTKNARYSFLASEPIDTIISRAQYCFSSPITHQVTGSGIDSTFVQNDSVFISAGGNSYYAGINAPDGFDGDILYVKKSGNDATAEKGNYFKPFLTVQAARDSAAKAGDLIVVYPGVYNETVNLGAKQLSYYLFDDAVLNGATISGSNNVNISGNGDILNSTSNSPFAPSGGATYSVNADSISVNYLSQSFRGDIYISARAWNSIQINGMINRANSDSTHQSTVILNTDVMYAGTLIFNIPNLFAEINVKKFYWRGLNGGAEIISNWQANWNGATFRLNATEIIDATLSNVPTRIMYIDAPANINFNNAHIEFNIGRFETNDFFYEYLNYTGANNKNAYIKVSCNDCIYTDTLSYVFKKTSTWPRNINIPLIFEGNYTVTQGSFLDVVDGTTTLWSGSMRFQDIKIDNKSTTKEPFRFETIAANKVYFDDAEIITGSNALAPITATVTGQNVYMKNLSTNAAAKDVDINYNYIDLTGRTQQINVNSTSTVSFYSPDVTLFGDNTSAPVTTTITACSAGILGWQFIANREDATINAWTLQTAAATDFWIKGSAQNTVSVLGGQSLYCKCIDNGGSYYWSVIEKTNIFDSNGGLTGNRTVDGNGNFLFLDSLSQFRARSTGGSANWRIDMFNNSSLPVVIEQAVGTDTAKVELFSSIGRATLQGTQEVYLESPDVKAGTLGDYVDYPSTQAATASYWRYNSDGTGEYVPAQNGVTFGPTDGSGDVTITFPEAMPDATYSIFINSGGSVPYIISPTSWTTTSVTARVFDTSGAAVTATGIVAWWSVIDY